MYNNGHEDIKKRLHYVNINAGFIKGANRFEIGYGRKIILSNSIFSVLFITVIIKWIIKYHQVFKNEKI